MSVSVSDDLSVIVKITLLQQHTHRDTELMVSIRVKSLHHKGPLIIEAACPTVKASHTHTETHT